MTARRAVVAPPEGLRGLLLDIDDTLLSTREAMREAGAAAALSLWPHSGPGLAKAAGRRYHCDPQGHFRAFTRGELDLDSMRRHRVREVADWMGASCSESDVARWKGVFDEVFGAVLVVFDDVLPTLQRCRESGLPLAFLTNASADYTWVKLQRCGLAELVREREIPVITKDTLGVGKPAPAVFEHAAQALGFAPSQVAHIGDELDVDPLAALAAGMGAGWVRRPGYEVSAPELATAAEHGLAPLPGLHEAVSALIVQDAGGFGSAASAR
ncbi:MAG: HAD family hydrolase [Ornithinimicrobium sp.]|uniref:HAD family hydrolase n=1 Tax=Ornithinimicrobium sp. TaxID=1977084 RepID=UPI0026E01731|nr:HAD family hydrolase [Ornithinimicrobium sp.]MDO5740481.1 HAD family hydrolase [Ornithinimicrobium sp.]